MKKTLLLLSILAVAVIAIWQIKSNAPAEQGQEQQKIKIAATFYPLAEFAKQIGGQHVQVENVTPNGVEPHDYEPTAQQIAGVLSAKIFVANGSGLDPWVDRISSDLSSGGVILVKMSDKFELLESKDEEFSHDPHFWLDPKLAIKEVEIIRDALIQADPANEADYRKNSDGYSAKLLDLDRQYREELASCTAHDVVTSHAAFAYLTKEYGLNQVAIAGLSPEEEPMPSRLAEIAEFARAKNIKYIFFETLVSDDLAKTIATEIGAGTLVLNPIEGMTEEDLAAGEDYLSIQRKNLANPKTALDCK